MYSPEEYFTIYPRIYLTLVSLEPYNFIGFLFIEESEDSGEPMMCLLEGVDYLSEYQVGGFEVSDPDGMCPIAAYFTYSKVEYDEYGEAEKMTGPEGDFYVFYELEDLLMYEQEEYYGYLLPVDESLYNGEEITITFDMEAMYSSVFAFWYEDGENECYLSAGEVNFEEEFEILFMEVTGCESIGWELAELPTEDTIIGPDGVEYWVYDDLQEYEQDLLEYE
jgi:hypothetical protein